MTTRDRAEGLARTLAAWERVRPPAGGFRLIVANDGSRDATSAVLDRWAARLPITALPLERAGQNAARNRALRLVEGDLVVFTDDDVIPRPDWLVRLREAADAHPEADVILGTVLPRFEVEPSASVLGAIRRGPSFAWVERPEEGFVDPTEGVGPSLAIRVQRFTDGLAFDESIGPDGSSSYAMGAETELLVRLRRQGVRAWYARGAIVEHVVTAVQVEEPFLLGRAFRWGRGRWRLGTARLARAQLRLGGIPLAAVADLGTRRIAYAWARARRDEAGALRAAWRLAVLAGQVAEIRSQRSKGAGLGVLGWLLPCAIRAVLPLHAPRRAAKTTPTVASEPASVADARE